MDTLIASIALAGSAVAAGIVIARVAIDAIAEASYRRTVNRRLRAFVSAR